MSKPISLNTLWLCPHYEDWIAIKPSAVHPIAYFNHWLVCLKSTDCFSNGCVFYSTRIRFNFIWIDSSFTSPGRPGIKFSILLDCMRPIQDRNPPWWPQFCMGQDRVHLFHSLAGVLASFRHGRPRNNQATLWFPELWNTGGSLLIYCQGFLTLECLEKGHWEGQQCPIVSESETLFSLGFLFKMAYKNMDEEELGQENVPLVSVGLDLGLLKYAVADLEDSPPKTGHRDQFAVVYTHLSWTCTVSHPSIWGLWDQIWFSH